MPLVVYNPGVDARVTISVLFEPIDKKNWIYQPNLVRWRHRNKAPRESLKINQEITQTLYDLNVLLKRNAIVKDNLTTITTHLQNGGAVDSAMFNDNLLAEDENLVLLGLDELSARIESVRMRVKRLEDNG